MTDVSTTWAEVIFRVKWIVIVSRWCYKVGPYQLYNIIDWVQTIYYVKRVCYLLIFVIWEKEIIPSVIRDALFFCFFPPFFPVREPCQSLHANRNKRKGSEDFNWNNIGLASSWSLWFVIFSPSCKKMEVLFEATRTWLRSKLAVWSICVRFATQPRPK